MDKIFTDKDDYKCMMTLATILDTFFERIKMNILATDQTSQNLSKIEENLDERIS